MLRITYCFIVSDNLVLIYTILKTEKPIRNANKINADF